MHRGLWTDNARVDGVTEHCFLVTFAAGRNTKVRQGKACFH